MYKEKADRYLHLAELCELLVQMFASTKASWFELKSHLTRLILGEDSIWLFFVAMLP